VSAEPQDRAYRDFGVEFGQPGRRLWFRTSQTTTRKTLEYAYDPTSGRNLTVDQFKDLYGPKRDGRGNLRVRPVLHCLACGVALHTVAEDSATAVRTWGHDPSPGTYCPIKAEGGGRYEVLAPRDPDLAAGAALRAAFFTRWQLHWGYVRDIAPFADIYTLIGFLQAADRTGFWNQRHLEEWHLPYVFLSTCDFPPPTGKAKSHRAEWLRFRFDGRYRTLEDLWIRAEPDFGFLRLRYHAPARRKEPSPAHFIVAEPIVPSQAWMTRAYPPPHSFAIDKMQRAFPRELGPGA